MSLKNLEELLFPVSYIYLAQAIYDFQGKDFDYFLKNRCKIDQQILNDPNGMIDGNQMQILLNEISPILKKNPECQSVLVNAFPLTIHGYVGLAAMTSQTIQQALDVGTRYLKQVMPAFSISIEKTDEALIIELIKTADFKDNNGLLTETVIFAFLTLNKFSKFQGNEIQVELKNKERYILGFYDLVPKLVVKTGTGKNRIHIPSDYLTAPLFTGNPDTHRMLVNTLEKKQQHLNNKDSYSTKIQNLLRSESEGFTPFSIEQICNSLNVSQRTLSRRLSEEGTSFKAIYTHLRIKTAKQLLEESDLNISSISEKLGFSNETSFSRFIKQNTGCSPSNLRNNKS